MDIEKLIERLRRYSEPLISYKLDSDFAAAVEEAATALSALQAENEKLRAELEQARTDCAVAEKNHADCIGELEQVKQERDAAVEYLRGKCQYCKKYLVCGIRRGPHDNCWQWRGPEED